VSGGCVGMASRVRMSMIINKRIIVLITVILLLAISGGVFYWWQKNQEEKKGEWVQLREAVKYPTEKEWEIIDTPEGKIVKNKKAGLEMKVPEGWKVEKVEIGDNEWIVNFVTPDAEFNENNFLIKGCGISAIIEYSKDDFEYITAYMKDPEYLKANGIELTKISGYPGTKEVVGENPRLGKAIAVRVPINNKVYIFDTLLVLKEEKRCSQEFEKFLEGVTILQ